MGIGFIILVLWSMTGDGGPLGLVWTLFIIGALIWWYNRPKPH
jgi:hypothetical protein